MRKLSLTELIAVLGGLMLGGGLFLTWYHLDNKRVRLNGQKGPFNFTGWLAHPTGRYLWLLAAVAPLILAYVIVRGHSLSWARGELTAVVSIAAFGLLLYVGVIGRPGEPRSLVHLQLGWFVAMAGVLLMLVGSALRASTTERPRKPPGVL